MKLTKKGCLQKRNVLSFNKHNVLRFFDRQKKRTQGKGEEI